MFSHGILSRWQTIKDLLVAELLEERMLVGGGGGAAMLEVQRVVGAGHGGEAAGRAPHQLAARAHHALLLALALGRRQHLRSEYIQGLHTLQFTVNDAR